MIQFFICIECRHKKATKEPVDGGNERFCSFKCILRYSSKRKKRMTNEEFDVLQKELIKEANDFNKLSNNFLNYMKEEVITVNEELEKLLAEKRFYNISAGATPKKVIRKRDLEGRKDSSGKKRRVEKEKYQQGEYESDSNYKIKKNHENDLRSYNAEIMGKKLEMYNKKVADLENKDNARIKEIMKELGGDNFNEELYDKGSAIINITNFNYILSVMNSSHSSDRLYEESLTAQLERNGVNSNDDLELGMKLKREAVYGVKFEMPLIYEHREMMNKIESIYDYKINGKVSECKPEVMNITREEWDNFNSKYQKKHKDLMDINSNFMQVGVQKKKKKPCEKDDVVDITNTIIKMGVPLEDFTYEDFTRYKEIVGNYNNKNRVTQKVRRSKREVKRELYDYFKKMLESRKIIEGDSKKIEIISNAIVDNFLKGNTELDISNLVSIKGVKIEEFDKAKEAIQQFNPFILEYIAKSKNLNTDDLNFFIDLVDSARAKKKSKHYGGILYDITCGVFGSTSCYLKEKVLEEKNVLEEKLGNSKKEGDEIAEIYKDEMKKLYQDTKASLDEVEKNINDTLKEINGKEINKLNNGALSNQCAINSNFNGNECYDDIFKSHYLCDPKNFVEDHLDNIEDAAFSYLDNATKVSKLLINAVKGGLIKSDGEYKVLYNYLERTFKSSEKFSNFENLRDLLDSTQCGEYELIDELVRNLDATDDKFNPVFAHLLSEYSNSHSRVLGTLNYMQGATVDLRKKIKDGNFLKLDERFTMKQDYQTIVNNLRDTYGVDNTTLQAVFLNLLQMPQNENTAYDIRQILNGIDDDINSYKAIQALVLKLDKSDDNPIDIMKDLTEKLSNVKGIDTSSRLYKWNNMLQLNNSISKMTFMRFSSIMAKLVSNSNILAPAGFILRLLITVSSSVYTVLAYLLKALFHFLFSIPQTGAIWLIDRISGMSFWQKLLVYLGITGTGAGTLTLLSSLDIYNAIKIAYAGGEFIFNVSSFLSSIGSSVFNVLLSFFNYLIPFCSTIWNSATTSYVGWIGFNITTGCCVSIVLLLAVTPIIIRILRNNRQKKIDQKKLNAEEIEEKESLDKNQPAPIAEPDKVDESTDEILKEVNELSMPKQYNGFWEELFDKADNRMKMEGIIGGKYRKTFEAITLLFDWNEDETLKKFQVDKCFSIANNIVLAKTIFDTIDAGSIFNAKMLTAVSSTFLLAGLHYGIKNKKDEGNLINKALIIYEKTESVEEKIEVDKLRKSLILDVRNILYKEINKSRWSKTMGIISKFIKFAMKYLKANPFKLWNLLISSGLGLYIFSVNGTLNFGAVSQAYYNYKISSNVATFSIAAARGIHMINHPDMQLYSDKITGAVMLYPYESVTHKMAQKYKNDAPALYSLQKLDYLDLMEKMTSSLPQIFLFSTMIKNATKSIKSEEMKLREDIEDKTREAEIKINEKNELLRKLPDHGSYSIYYQSIEDPLAKKLFKINYARQNAEKIGLKKEDFNSSNFIEIIDSSIPIKEYDDIIIKSQDPNLIPTVNGSFYHRPSYITNKENILVIKDAALLHVIDENSIARLSIERYGSKNLTDEFNNIMNTIEVQGSTKHFQLLKDARESNMIELREDLIKVIGKMEKIASSKELEELKEKIKNDDTWVNSTNRLITNIAGIASKKIFGS